MKTLNIKFFDSHIHLNSEKLKIWFEKFHEKYDQWIFNNVSTTLEDFYTALEQSKLYWNVFVTAGIHPLEIENLDLQKTFASIESKISKNSKIIAIGETGLDFYRLKKEDCFENQKKWFLKHIELAQKKNLPLILHVRASHNEVLEILKDNENAYGVIHCFDSNLYIANKYLNLKSKWMISISPVVFRENSECKNIIEYVSLDRLLVETDSPYLAENNEKVKEIIQFIADKKNISFEECKEKLWNNFFKFFNLIEKL